MGCIREPVLWCVSAAARIHGRRGVSHQHRRLPPRQVSHADPDHCGADPDPQIRNDGDPALLSFYVNIIIFQVSKISKDIPVLCVVILLIRIVKSLYRGSDRK